MDTLTPTYTPLPHQRKFVSYMLSDQPGLRSVIVWPRRHGKDLSALNVTWAKSQQRVGTYFYFLPTYSQARKIIWNGMDGGGKRFLDYIPRELIARTHETEMRLTLTNGSIIQFVGSDNIDSIVGTNPVGCVFSEYALQDPQGYRLVSPILRQNGGWAVFCYTPRGHNHGYDLYTMAKDNPKWFVERLTIDDADMLTEEDMEDERATGIPEELIQQEYYTSFSMTLAGAYFGQQMMKAQERGRIRELTYNPRMLVHTAWDFGVNDSTAIWFVQYDHRTVWAIDYYENRNLGLDHYAQVLKDRDYVYGVHLAPHDVMKRSQRDGITLLEWCGQELHLHFDLVKRRSKIDQVQAAHFLIPRTIFCNVNCERGIDGMRNYEREWDAKNKVHRNMPKHNWASHVADAYMTLSCGIDLLTDDGYSDEQREAYSTGALNARPAVHRPDYSTGRFEHSSEDEERYPAREVVHGFSR